MSTPNHSTEYRAAIPSSDGLYTSQSSKVADVAHGVAKAGTLADMTGDKETAITAKYLLEGLDEQRRGSLADALAFTSLHGSRTHGGLTPAEVANLYGHGPFVMQPGTTTQEPKLREKGQYPARDRFTSQARRMPGWYGRYNRK